MFGRGQLVLAAPSLFIKQNHSIMQNDKFNFIYDGKHHPNYRVEYENENQTFSVSSPAIFSNDKEAIEAALFYLPEWIKHGVRIAIVLKYTRSGLKEIWRKSA
jgi:hypothetical protein